MSRRVFDCFTFFDELDVLELRLSELAPLVDRFVLVEGPHTFTGQAKSLVFERNKERFRHYLHKIEHVVLDDMPSHGPSAWDREHFSRRGILRGLLRASPDDFVLISDVDEIPMPDRLEQVISDPQSASRITVFESICFIYYFNLWAEGRAPSTVQAPRLLLRKYVRDPQAVRAFKPRISRKRSLGSIETFLLRARALWRFGSSLTTSIETQSAWHFTYQGKPEQIRAKILAYSHTEKALPQFTDTQRLAEAIANRNYIFDQTERFRELPLGEPLPKSLQYNPERWREGLTPSAMGGAIDKR